jgi:tetratricopeptide (TPR) repeat protein
LVTSSDRSGLSLQAGFDTAAATQIDSEVRRLRDLLERSQFTQALAAAKALLTRVPEHRDVLYMLAIAQRYLEMLPEALATLRRLEELHPDYPRLHQERGHCHVALRAAQPAIAAFDQAVKLNPSLVGSWTALHSLCRATGRTAAAANAAAQLEALAKLPPEIVTAYSMYADHELQEAESVVRRYLRTHGPQREGLRLLAQIAMRMDALEEAEILLEQVVRLAPEYDAARYDYAAVLLRRHQHARAREQLQTLLEKGPSNPAYRGLLASVYAGFGAHDKALPLYRELLEQTPDDPDLHLSLANALKTVGETRQAIAAYRAAAAARPRHGEAYWGLANLKTFRFSDSEIAQMRSDESSPGIRLEDRINLCFALGKALEDAHRFAESFGYYERGNALKKSECRYRPEPFERSAAQQAKLLTPEFFAARSGAGCDSHDPIFIVGLPRSGSTLIEQILACHSQVDGTMELADVPRLVQDLEGQAMRHATARYPALLAELAVERFKEFGDNYLSVTRLQRGSKPFFIDKMPNNFRHIGLIHLMLPNAKIIDARRQPMACCFSNFKQLFAAGQLFTYSLEDLARYYRMYVALMAHWDVVLPGRVLRVQYEEVVADLEGSTRRILEFCGLEFERGCIEFHRSRRFVHTASAEQVRQPINRAGIDQWRNFEPWLGPLRTALGELAPHQAS